MGQDGEELNTFVAGSIQLLAFATRMSAIIAAGHGGSASPDGIPSASAEGDAMPSRINGISCGSTQISFATSF
jgi:hypothetical protein